MLVVLLKNKCPQSQVPATDKVTSLMLEHGIFVRNMDKFIVALPFLIANISKIRVSLFAIFADRARIVILNGR